MVVSIILHDARANSSVLLPCVSCSAGNDFDACQVLSAQSYLFHPRCCSLPPPLLLSNTILKLIDCGVHHQAAAITAAISMRIFFINIRASTPCNETINSAQCGAVPHEADCMNVLRVFEARIWNGFLSYVCICNVMRHWCYDAYDIFLCMYFGARAAYLYQICRLCRSCVVHVCVILSFKPERSAKKAHSVHAIWERLRVRAMFVLRLFLEGNRSRYGRNSMCLRCMDGICCLINVYVLMHLRHNVKVYFRVIYGRSELRGGMERRKIRGRRWATELVLACCSVEHLNS